MEANDVTHVLGSGQRPAAFDVLARLCGVPGGSGVRRAGGGGRCPVAGRLHHYVIPARGRWLVVYRLPGIDGWAQPVSDHRLQASAQAEADALNGSAT